MLLVRLFRRHNDLRRQFGRYLLVGAIAAVIDRFLLNFLYEQTGLHYQLATIAGFCAGMVVNYLLSWKWVFVAKIPRSQHLVRFLFSTVIGLVGLVFTLVLMWFFHDYLGWSVRVASVLSLVVVFWNFGARKYFLFR